MLTLFTTPVVYLSMDRLRHRFGRKFQHGGAWQSWCRVASPTTPTKPLHGPQVPRNWKRLWRSPYLTPYLTPT